MGFEMPCGTDGGYKYVFIGSVLSASEISDREKRLLCSDGGSLFRHRAA